MSFGMERSRGVSFEVGKSEPRKKRVERPVRRFSAEELRRRPWVGTAARLMPSVWRRK